MSQANNPFDRGIDEAIEYDAWYDTVEGHEVLAGEVAALAQLFRDIPRPWLDLGTGTGRFGAAFNVDVGLDPAASMLSVASTRLPSVVRGIAEALPFRPATIGGVLSVTTFEFLASAAQAVHEVARVLGVDGVFVLGFLPAAGDWARAYTTQGQGDASPFHHAHFFTPGEASALGSRAGLRFDGYAEYAPSARSAGATPEFLAARFRKR